MSADFWAGYLSGAAGILIGNPLDLVKTRLQASKAPTSPDILAQATTAAAAAPRSFKQHFDSTGTLVRGGIFHSTLSLSCRSGLCRMAAY